MKEDLDDIKLRQLFKNELPKAGHNEWFIRKTLNRLPPKQKSPISKIELISYTISIIAILISWVIANSTFQEDGTITINEIIILISLLSTFVAIITATIRQIVRAF